MIKFGIQDYETEFNDWAKHHAELSIHVRREYLNEKGTVNTKDEKLLRIIEANPEKLLKKQVTLYDRITFETSTAIDYYLPLQNLDYQERNIEYYNVGSSNTKQVSKIRMFFRLDYVDFILDYSYKTAGTFAMSFHSLIDGSGSIRDILEEVATNQYIKFEDKGIKVGDNKDEGEDFYILGIDEYKQPTEFGIESKELMRSLVGIEIYAHETKID